MIMVLMVFVVMVVVVWKPQTQRQQHPGFLTKVDVSIYSATIERFFSNPFSHHLFGGREGFFLDVLEIGPNIGSQKMAAGTPYSAILSLINIIMCCWRAASRNCLLCLPACLALPFRLAVFCRTAHGI